MLEIQPIQFASQMNRNSAIDSEMRSVSAQAVFRVLPWSRMMKNPAPARLAKIRTNVAMISTFMSAFYGRGSFLAGSALAVGLIALTASLGLWQLDRAGEKRDLQAARERALAAAPLALTAERLRSAATDGGDRDDRLDGRRVRLEGVFEPSRSVFLDNRTRDGVAGFHVLTPMRIDGSDTRVMVLRGWVARDPRERSRLPDVPTPSSPVRLEGLAVRDLPQPMVLAAEPEPGPADRIWQHYAPARFARWAGVPVAALVVRQTAEADGLRDGLARDWNLPGAGVDKHRAYAFQWFAMTFAVVAGWFWLARRALKAGPRPGGSDE